jgi:hypothetical protein
MSTPYEKAIASIGEAHALDPRKINVNGKEIPYELHYAEKMNHYLSLRCHEPSDILRLAIWSQHLKRWEIPRDSYPMTRIGYHSWRTYLKKRQAELVQKICLDSGYSDEDAERVAALVRKEDLKTDEETQILEDVACLVFLDDQFEEFGKEHDEEKIINILRKTWVKMTEEGHQLALKIPMSDRSKELIQTALSGS